MSINRCDICKEIEFPACSATISFGQGLGINESYYVWLRDKDDHAYSLFTASQPDETMIVTLTDFVTAYGVKFTKASGVWELSLSTSETIDTSENITINGVDYPCLNISFFDLN